MSETSPTPRARLSPQAIDELVEIILDLAKLIPNGMIKHQIRVMRPNLKVAFEDNAEKVVEDVLGPLHAWMHEQEVPVIDKAKKG